jgi:hypothetical protein
MSSPELKLIKDLLLIVLPSSPAIANTYVVRSPFILLLIKENHFPVCKNFIALSRTSSFPD